MKKFLTKNIRAIQVDTIPQKDIEYIVNLCLILSKLVAIRFDSLATHLYKIIIYPRLDRCSSFEYTYEHLWQNINNISLALNDLLQGNGVVFCLSNIKKATHILDDFNFLFHAKNNLNVYLLNLQLQQQVVDGNVDKTVQINDSLSMDEYLQWYRPQFMHWQIPYEFLEPIEYDLWKLTDNMISQHPTIYNWSTFDVFQMSQQFELNASSFVYMYMTSFSFLGPHYFDALDLWSNAFDYYPILELILCVDFVDTPWTEDYWLEYDERFSDISANNFDDLLALILNSLDNDYDIQSSNLMSNKNYFYLMYQYVDDKNDYLLMYLAYCFFSILYNFEYLDINTTLSQWPSTWINQASNISIYDLQFYHDYIFLSNQFKNNYGLFFMFNFDEDFFFSAMGFSIFVEKITRALLVEESIFRLDPHGNFYFRSEDWDWTYSFKFDFHEGIYDMWFSNVLVFHIHIDYNYMRYRFNVLLKRAVLSILKLYGYEFFRFNAIQFKDYYLNLDDLTLTLYEGNSMSHFKYRCFAYFPIRIKSCLLEYIYFDEFFNYQLVSHSNMGFLLYIYIACFLMQVARPFDKILCRQLFIIDSNFTHFTFDFLFTILNDLYSTVVNWPIQRMLDLIRYKLDKHDQADDFLFTYVVQQFTYFDAYFITNLIEDAIEDINTLNHTAFNFGYLFNYKTQLKYRPFIFVDYKVTPANNINSIIDIYSNTLKNLTSNFEYLDLIVSSNLLNNSNIYNFISYFNMENNSFHSLYFMLNLVFLSFNNNSIPERFKNHMFSSTTFNHSDYKLVPLLPVFCLCFYSYLSHYNIAKGSDNKHYLCNLLQPNDWQHVTSKLYPQMNNVFINSLVLKGLLSVPNTCSWPLLFDSIDNDIKLFSLFCKVNFINDKVFYMLSNQLTNDF